MVASPAWAAEFIVNSTGDAGDVGPSGVCNTVPFPEGTEPECTLRAAIDEANATTAADTIDFDIPGGGVQTIRPMTALPPITQPVTVDGYGQRPCSEGYPAPCSRPNTKALGSDAVLLVELDGSNVSAETGLELQASNSTIQGLVVNRFRIGIVARSFNNKIQGNFIGTDPSGTQDLGNGVHGVSAGSGSTTVGGTFPAARNLISGNTFNGVSMLSGNKVEGNLIGTKKDGTTALGNGSHGVEIFDLATGETAASANIIAFNGQDGIAVTMATPSGSIILNNSVHSNGGLGIDLDNDGPTPNDAGDVDTGPNNLQNYPTLTRATTSRLTGRSIVRGTLNSTPGDTFVIQLFTNPAQDPSGFGEGRRLLRTLSVTTDASGNASFGMRARKLRGFISATATKVSTGDTSEFSEAKKVARKL